MKFLSHLHALRSLAFLAAISAFPAHAILDTNNNGLSDLWEKQHNNGNLFPNTFLATNEEDQDGWTNAKESIAGTDPFKANPPDGIVAVEITPSLVPGAFTLTWPTLIGKNYQLQVSTDLVTWSNLGPPITTTQDTHTIGLNTTQPDSSIPANVFWQVAVTDLDTDLDGLTDAEEQALGLDPQIPFTVTGIPDLWLATHFENALLTSGPSTLSADADPDGDGQSNAREVDLGSDPNDDDTDDDGLSDGQDADPNDPLVIWQPSTASSYILIEIDELNDYYAYDINDKAEVLFPNKLWKAGSVTDLPEPIYSGPAKETDETYASIHQSWFFMNNHGRFVGVGDTSFPEPYIDDMNQETIFVYDTNAQQANFDFTKNVPMWDYANLTLHPIGITDTGEVVSEFLYYTYEDPNEENVSEEYKLAIFNSATTSFSFLPLPTDYEATFASSFPNSRVTPNGWISTLIEATSLSTGSPYKLALWNPSKQLIELPEQATGQYDRISLTELPNQKIGLIASEGIVPASQVFLPDSIGVMRHSEKLSGKKLIAFSGDGTALSYDGMVWRNGKFTPMHDICEKWSDYEEDYRFHPLKGNKHGTFLIQANKKDSENHLITNKHILAVPVDLDFIKPGTENDPQPVEIAEDKEDSEGEVVNINWDDDDDSEGDGGHAKLVFKNDFDDTNANNKEDDMIQLRIHRVNVDGAKVKLKYDSNFIKIWRNIDRSGEIISESTEIEAEETQTVYLEGKKLTLAETPTIVEMFVKTNASEAYQPGDKVSVHVATPIIICIGRGPEASGVESTDISSVISSGDGLGKKRRDYRKNTVIFNGKSTDSQKVLYYSFDIYDVMPEKTSIKNNAIKIKSIHNDKEMKMGLSLEGAHVIFSGHANMGLGPNFNASGTTTVDDYMNISNFGIAGIILKSTDIVAPAPFEDIEHGGENFALREQDILETATNEWVELTPGYKVRRFTTDTLNFTKIAATTSIPAYHFIQQGDYQNWVTIVKSEGDRPVLNYASCSMLSCNSGRHFGKVLNHGKLLYTTNEAYSTVSGDLPLPTDTYVADDVPPSVYVSYVVSDSIIAGLSWSAIVTYLNKNQHTNAGEDPKPNLYKITN